MKHHVFVYCTWLTLLAQQPFVLSMERTQPVHTSAERSLLEKLPPEILLSIYSHLPLDDIINLNKASAYLGINFSLAQLSQTDSNLLFPEFVQYLHRYEKTLSQHGQTLFSKVLHNAISKPNIPNNEKIELLLQASVRKFCSEQSISILTQLMAENFLPTPEGKGFLLCILPDQLQLLPQQTLQNFARGYIRACEWKNKKNIKRVVHIENQDLNSEIKRLRELDHTLRERAGFDPELPAHQHQNQTALNENNLQPLLNDGADINAQDNKGLTALHKAVALGSYERVALLIKYKADVQLYDEKGLTPLHFAASKGFLSLAQLLCEHNADASTKDTSYKTALHHALRKRQNDLMIKFLLTKDAPAPVDEQDYTGATALYTAVNGYPVEILRLLQQGAPPNTPNQCSIETIQLLLRQGANPNIPNQQGLTPLHRAVMGNRSDVVALLLDHKADKTVKNKNGHTPLDIAEQRKLSDIIKLLQ